MDGDGDSGIGEGKGINLEPKGPRSCVNLFLSACLQLSIKTLAIHQTLAKKSSMMEMVAFKHLKSLDDGYDFMLYELCLQCVRYNV